MGRKLHANVLLRDPKTGGNVVFEAGSEPPKWAEEAITNDEVWASDAEDSADAEDSDLPEDAPPLGGKGSGVDAWRDYATSTFGLEFEEGTDRDDIVSAVADAHAEGSGS